MGRDELGYQSWSPGDWVRALAEADHVLAAGCGGSATGPPVALGDPYAGLVRSQNAAAASADQAFLTTKAGPAVSRIFGPLRGVAVALLPWAGFIVRLRPEPAGSMLPRRSP